MDTRLLRPWDFLGKSTGVGCLFLLQGTSQPRDRNQVSRIVDSRFAVWATREVAGYKYQQLTCWHVSPLWSLGQHNTIQLFILSHLKDRQYLPLWIQNCLWDIQYILSLKRWAILSSPLSYVFIILLKLARIEMFPYLTQWITKEQMRTSCPMPSIWFI